MTPRAVVIHGDARVLPLADVSVDAVVTDPPYDLTSGKNGGTGTASINLASPAGRSGISTGNGSGGFMGKAWDATGVAFDPATWRECLRVLKPGGHLLAFGGSRTFHRLACAIEDAGFEIRDTISWLYASGFPKSLDVGKAIDKAAGAQRQVVGGPTRHGGGTNHVYAQDEWTRNNQATMGSLTAPATTAARRWHGWGTALKPAWEPIIVARKPLAGTVAGNVQLFGTGALNIDACRLAAGDPVPAFDRRPGGRPRDEYRTGTSARNGDVTTSGRWPANVALTHTADCQPAGTRRVRGNNQPPDPSAGEWTGAALNGSSDGTLNRTRSHGYAGADGYETVQAWTCSPGCPIGELDRQSGDVKAGGTKDNRGRRHWAGISETRTSTRDDNFPSYADTGGASRFFPTFRYEAKATPAQRPRVNGIAHPTVKPLDLMRWLVRLVTPPGGTVLDPFAGSGTTGEAAVLEGFTAVLIEREADYLPLIRARLSKPLQSVLPMEVRDRG